MIKSPSQRSNRQRSITFTGHPSLLRRCHTLLRSISNLSSGRMNDMVEAATNDSIVSPSSPPSPPRRTFTSVLRNRSTVENVFSPQLNQDDFEIGNATEMHEFIRCSSSEENLRTLNRTDLTNSGEAAVDSTDHRSLFSHSVCSTPRTGTFMHRTWSQIKRKIQAASYEPTKNTGFLIVNDVESDPVLVGFDPQETQNAQPCVQIHKDDFDLNRIQFTSIPSSASLVTIPPPFLGSSIGPVDNHSNHDLITHSTRGSVECGVPQSDSFHVHTTQLSQAISATSPSSTNSSAHEYSAVDRSILDDTEYVRAQQLDLERLTVLEIGLAKERQALKSDLMDIYEFDGLYDETLKQNEDLKRELKLLEEEDELFYSAWACGICTYHNQAYIDSQRDICEMCEGPSPLKQATLIK